jgi:hypothetical protein
LVARARFSGAFVIATRSDREAFVRQRAFAVARLSM